MTLPTLFRNLVAIAIIDLPALVTSAARMREALLAAQEMTRVALPQFDWGRSCLSAEAIRLLNETPGVIRAALEEKP